MFLKQYNPKNYESMKQKLSILTSFILVLFIVSSCIFSGPSIKGNGNVKEETRSTGDFTEVKVSRGMNVYISNGETTKVVVKADENLIDAIETEVVGDVLNVTVNKFIRQSKSLKVFVTVPNIEVIKTTSGSNVFSEDSLKTANLEIKSTAGSNVHLTVEAGELVISAAAGSNIFLDGSAKSLTMKANSGSNIKAGDLQAENCDVKVSSGANIWVKVQNGLTAKASSGGNIWYSGQPSPLEIEKSSGGNVFKN
jgi:hypothetical protein